MRPLKQAVYSSRSADKFVVRLPDGMRERIAAVAKSHHRSMNSEIISRLEHSLLEEGGVDGSLEVVHSNYTANLLRQIDVQPWNPQVGNLVRRRDTLAPLGSIAGFTLSTAGIMAIIDGFDDAAGVRKVPNQAVGMLVPMDITEVIEMSSSTVHTALERIAQRGE